MSIQNFGAITETDSAQARAEKAQAELVGVLRMCGDLREANKLLAQTCDVHRDTAQAWAKRAEAAEKENIELRLWAGNPSVVAKLQERVNTAEAQLAIQSDVAVKAQQRAHAAEAELMEFRARWATKAQELHAAKQRIAELEIQLENLQSVATMTTAELKLLTGKTKAVSTDARKAHDAAVGRITRLGVR